CLILRDRSAVVMINSDVYWVSDQEIRPSRSTSAAAQESAWAVTRSIAGLMLSKVRLKAVSTHWSPIKARSRVSRKSARFCHSVRKYASITAGLLQLRDILVM